jgi:hypothetical protein
VIRTVAQTENGLNVALGNLPIWQNLTPSVPLGRWQRRNVDTLETVVLMDFAKTPQRAIRANGLAVQARRRLAPRQRLAGLFLVRPRLRKTPRVVFGVSKLADSQQAGGYSACLAAAALEAM